jgi:hypothetical protein
VREAGDVTFLQLFVGPLRLILGGAPLRVLGGPLIAAGNEVATAADLLDGEFTVEEVWPR